MSERGRCGLKEAVKLILRVMSQRLCIVSLLIMKYLIVYPYFPAATEASIGSRTWWPSTWTTCTT